jgi:hypothetical protein
MIHSNDFSNAVSVGVFGMVSAFWPLCDHGKCFFFNIYQSYEHGKCFFSAVLGSVRVRFVPKTPYTALYRSWGYFLKNHNFFHKNSLPLKFWDSKVHILKMQGKKSQFFSQRICGVIALPILGTL